MLIFLLKCSIFPEKYHVDHSGHLIGRSLNASLCILPHPLFISFFFFPLQLAVVVVLCLFPSLRGEFFGTLTVSLLFAWSTHHFQGQFTAGAKHVMKK